MFEGVESAANDEGARKGRFAASTGISVGICVVLGVVLAAVGTGVAASDDKDQQDVQVTFSEPAAPEPKVDEPPPPPPAPKPELKRRAANTMAKTPTIMPGEQLAEADASGFSGSGAGAIEDITAPVIPDEVLKSASAPPPPAPAASVVARVERGDPAPVDLVDDDWRKPEADGANIGPSYPEDARKRGRDGVVVLRFLITRDGRVTRISVVSGDEPFVSAALAAVKTWRYAPGRLSGRARDAWHQVRLPFQLGSNP
jgi:periplasmic protein TonB